MQTKTSERIREIKQEAWRRRKKKIKILFSAILFALVLYGTVNREKILTILLWDLPAFRIQEVQITPPEARPLITGLMAIETGGNLLFLDIDDLRKQILRIKEVENCSVKKIFPSKIAIEVILREPWVAIDNNNSLFFVDRTGKIVAPPDNSENFIRIEGMEIKDTGISEKDIWKFHLLKEIETWYNFHNLRQHFPIGSIRIEKPTEIILNSVGKSQKILFIDEGIAERFKKLRALLDLFHENKTEWDYIDLRFEHPHVKHRDAR